MNVIATELATGHDAGDAVGNAVTVAVAYGPLATELEHEDGSVLPPDSPHEAGTVPLRRAIAVRNEASGMKSVLRYNQTCGLYDLHDQVKSIADSGTPFEREYCSASAPPLGVYISIRLIYPSAYAFMAAVSVEYVDELEA